MYTIHPMAEVFPMLSGHDFDALMTDVAANGVLVPIVMNADGTVLVDGRNRVAVCEKLGRSFESLPKAYLAPDTDLDEYVFSMNLSRRMMNASQRAMSAARALPIYTERAKERMMAGCAAPYRNISVGSGSAAEVAGTAFRVSDNYVLRARKILDYPAVAARVDSGELNLVEALKVIEKLRDPEKEASTELSPFDAVLKLVGTLKLDSADRVALCKVLAASSGFGVTLHPLGASESVK